MNIAYALWDADRAGLTTPETETLLRTVHTAAGEAHPADGDAATYLVAPSAYRPYVSTTMPRDGGGYRMAARALRVSRSPGLQQSLLDGWVGDALRRLTARQAAALWDADTAPIARPLALLNAAAPRKGNEAAVLWREYRRRNPGARSPEMTVRDYLGCLYYWQFQRSVDERLPNLFGSLLTFSLAVDFVDAADGAGLDGEDPYLVAASEGFAALAGAAPNRMAREMTLGGAISYVKDAMARGDRAADRNPELSLTPDELFTIRQWDGFHTPLLRLAFGSRPYRHLTDGSGTYLPALACPDIARVFGNALRYDDVVDAIADWGNHETCNELLTALAHAGPGAVHGYGDALAQALDATLACACGRPGHEEAAEYAMGFNLFYLLVPRYVFRRQLAALHRAGGDVAEAFAPPAAGTRLRSAGGRLASGWTLHTEDWRPRWRPAASTVEALARRVARRCLSGAAAPARLVAAAESALARCDRADDDDACRRLTQDWQDVFDAALAAGGLTNTPQAAPLRRAIGRLWGSVVLAGAADDARLFIETDIAVRATFGLPDDAGRRVRRAFFGVTSSAVDHSGFSPYGRIANGIGTLCRSAERDRTP
ncbi:hypothetical protein [Actinomadura litoris]|uniref:Uncharacterized protein n=1 Tax=Actinomadura litoris TaxID=2678616 RepID=A0A7K1L5D8_9ACTN|nr:hypothetical protein [Actinomadura litoris]MUN39628.1 hypothetical protein [Actinomadura litoris]